MIYQKQEFVEDETGDSDFPVKIVDRLESLEGETTRFIGRAAINMRTPAGIQQFPISFQIDADSVAEAFQKYSDAAQPKIQEVRQRLQSQLQKLREQQEGNIVTPEGGGGSEIITFEDIQGEE